MTQVTTKEAINNILSNYNLRLIDLSTLFHIPYRTLQNWSGGISEAPTYVIDMIDTLLLVHRDLTAIKRDREILEAQLDITCEKLEKAQDLLHDKRFSEAIEIIDNI